MMKEKNVGNQNSVGRDWGGNRVSLNTVLRNVLKNLVYKQIK